MKDKLSREEELSYYLDDVFKWYLDTYVSTPSTKRELKKALRELKCLLTPVSEEKLKKFIDEWMYNIEWKDKDELKHDYIPRMLNAYDNLREGKEG